MCRWELDGALIDHSFTKEEEEEGRVNGGKSGIMGNPLDLWGTVAGPKYNSEASS